MGQYKVCEITFLPTDFPYGKFIKSLLILPVGYIISMDSNDFQE